MFLNSQILSYSLSIVDNFNKKSKMEHHTIMDNSLKRNYAVSTLSEDSSDDDSDSNSGFIEPAKKAMKVEENIYSNASMRMMQNM